MSSMIHSVIARNDADEIEQVIVCFSERQVTIATGQLKKEYPKAHIKVDVKPDEHHPE